MITNIDIAIVVAFLIINLTLGVWVGRGIKTIKEYAIGDRNFSTATLSATIIATWISGSYFTVCLSQAYSDGIWFIPAAVGNIFSTLMIGYIFAPRMKEFFGSLSVAETMGNLFGKHVRLVSAIAAIAQAIAMTALQIKVFASVFTYFFGFSSLYATCTSSFVVILYSTLGGIKAVTFTDKIQFLTFGIFIPLFFFFVIKIFGDFEAISTAMHTNPLLDYSQLINWDDPKFVPSFITFLWFTIPGLNSATFQRILMAKNTQQVSRSFTIATIGSGIIALLVCAIGIIILSVNPNLGSTNIVMYVLDHYSFDGLRGITIIGIVAMVMSTADSWINVGSVLFAHDLCKPLGIKFKSELFLSRVFALTVGFGALLLVLFNESVFQLFTLQANFYTPIITAPLILAIFGFRSSGKSVLIAMGSGALSVIIWKIYIQPATGIDSVMPSMLVNFIALIGAHYLLRQPGGWVGIKDDSDLKTIQLERKNSRIKFKKFFSQLYSTNIFRINIFDHCKKYLPKYDITYTYFAIALTIMTSVVIVALDKEIYSKHLILISLLQGMTLLISSIFISHKLWPSDFRTKYIGLIWYFAIFFGLVFISSFLALISKFSPVSVAVLILNLTIIGFLMSWQMTFVTIISGIALALFSYVFYMGNTPDLTSELHNMEWDLLYILLAIAGLLLIFFKPKQEHEALLEAKNNYLENLMDYKDSELQKAIDLKNEFLRNLQHEAHTPITGITSLGQVLWESYDLLSEKQRRQGLEDIAKSSDRLASLVNNMIDLSKLSSFKYELNIDKVNLSDLIKERLETCKKLYLKDKDLEFIEKVDSNVIAYCDSYYIMRVVDNLIINAITYSKSGKIHVSLTLAENAVEFSVQDEGIGIPATELHDIFGAFVVSSKTRTPAGGRGIGLALCKKSIEEHNGKIWAESNGKKGAIFRFMIPL